MNLEYKDKYLKYKSKYINLKKQIAGTKYFTNPCDKEKIKKDCEFLHPEYTINREKRLNNCIAQNEVLCNKQNYKVYQNLNNEDKSTRLQKFEELNKVRQRARKQKMKQKAQYWDSLTVEEKKAIYDKGRQKKNCRVQCTTICDQGAPTQQDLDELKKFQDMAKNL